MLIRITRECFAAINGFAVAPLLVGRVYDIKEPLARFLIGSGCAVSCDDASHVDDAEATTRRPTFPVSSNQEPSSR
jgi:hypothetical protein